MYSNALYKNAPVPLQSFMISSKFLLRKLLREGRKFERMLQEIEKTECLSAADIKVWQETKLGAFLSHAVLNVPFYRDMGLASVVESNSPFEALQSFPVIDKAIVRDGGKRFLADNAQKPLFDGCTSGTTGAPLRLSQDLPAINRENAFVMRQLKWAGFSKGDRRAWLRGDMVVPVAQNEKPYWRFNFSDNMLMFSPCHLKESTADEYIRALESFDPVIISAYPSLIVFLAKWLEVNSLFYRGKSLSAVITSSEMLDDKSRELVSQRFSCNVFDWYGQYERVAAIGTCKCGSRHFIADYSYVELFENDDGLKEIVGSGFNNFAMPLIRYRTGDYVALDDRECLCGLAMPIVKNIVGRGGDFVTLFDGRVVGPINNILKNITGIIESQFIYSGSDEICVRVVAVVPSDGLVEAIRSNVSERFGKDITVSVHFVSGIERDRSGKLRTLVVLRDNKK